MIYTVKNKGISLGGSSEVFDENDELVYKVQGKVFSPTKVKRIYDKENKIVFTVRNKFWRFFNRSAFIIDADGQKIAKVVKKFMSINKFIVQGYKDEITIDGKFINRAMPVIKNGQEIGAITREYKLLNDAFSVDSDEENMPFMVALTIAIDNINDEEKEDNRK